MNSTERLGLPNMRWHLAIRKYPWKEVAEGIRCNIFLVGVGKSSFMHVLIKLIPHRK